MHDLDPAPLNPNDIILAKTTIVKTVEEPRMDMDLLDVLQTGIEGYLSGLIMEVNLTFSIVYCHGLCLFCLVPWESIG